MLHFFSLKRKYRQFNKKRKVQFRAKLCHAPFNALSFSPEGEVRTCCYGTDILGNIKENTLIEIINSAKLKSIQNYILKGELPDNCQHCLTDINNRKFENVKINRFDKESLIGSGINYMEFHLETTCNLKCIMCSDYKSSCFNKDKVDFDFDFDSFFEQLKPFLKDVKHANFLGGEPFLINSYFRIWDELIKSNPNCQIHVNTNGTILNDKIKNIITKGKFAFTISIDAFDKSTYEQIRIGSNFDKTLVNLDYFISHSKSINKALHIAVCPMTKNWQKIPEISEFIKDQNLNLDFNYFISPYNLALWQLPKDDLQKIKIYLTNNNPFDISSSNYFTYQSLIKDIDIWIKKDDILNKNLTKLHKTEFIKLYVKYLERNQEITIKEINLILPIFDEFNNEFFTTNFLNLLKKMSLLSLLKNNYSIKTLSMLITNQLYFSIFS